MAAAPPVRPGEDGMNTLERRCHLLLRAYPAGYRQDRGEEIIGTLLEATPTGRSWPLARDVRGLVMGGLRARAALNRRLTTAANLRIAVLVGVAAYLAFSAVALVALVSRAFPVRWPLLVVAALIGLTVALVWIASPRAARLAAAVTAAAAVCLVAPWRLGSFGWPVTGLVCLGAVALLARAAERPSRRWLWPVALIASLLLLAIATPRAGTVAFGAVLAATGVVSLLLLVIDARPAIATAVFVLAFWLPSGINNLARGVGIASGVPALVIVSVVAAVAVWRLHRQSAGVGAPQS
jgi:hypothetical protein